MSSNPIIAPPDNLPTRRELASFALHRLAIF